MHRDILVTLLSDTEGLGRRHALLEDEMFKSKYYREFDTSWQAIDHGSYLLYACIKWTLCEQ